MEGMKDTNRYLWSSKNKIEKQRSMIQKNSEYFTVFNSGGQSRHICFHRAYRTVSEQNLFMSSAVQLTRVGFLGTKKSPSGPNLISSI